MESWSHYVRVFVWVRRMLTSSSAGGLISHRRIQVPPIRQQLRGSRRPFCICTFLTVKTSDAAPRHPSEDPELEAIAAVPPETARIT